MENSDNKLIAFARRNQMRMMAGLWAAADAEIFAKGLLEGQKGDHLTATAAGISTFGSLVGLAFGESAVLITAPCWSIAGAVIGAAGIHTRQFGLIGLGASILIGQAAHYGKPVVEFAREFRPGERLLNLIATPRADVLEEYAMRRPLQKLLEITMADGKKWGAWAMNLGAAGLAFETMRLGMNSIFPHLATMPATIGQKLTEYGLLNGLQLRSEARTVTDFAITLTALGLALAGNHVSSLETAEAVPVILPRRSRSASLKLFEI